ncbi:hypothetical protein AMTRI_Chr03g49800 [Amborella trichopoda]
MQVPPKQKERTSAGRLFVTAGPPFVATRPPILIARPHFTQCWSSTTGPHFTQLPDYYRTALTRCQSPYFGGIEERGAWIS